MPQISGNEEETEKSDPQLCFFLLEPETRNITLRKFYQEKFYCQIRYLRGQLPPLLEAQILVSQRLVQSLEVFLVMKALMPHQFAFVVGIERAIPQQLLLLF